MKTIMFTAVILALMSCQSPLRSWQLFQDDDKVCKEMGAKPGTTMYVRCRLIQQVLREEFLRSLGESNIRPSTSCAVQEFGRGYYNVDCD